MSNSVACAICGLQVYADGPSNKLKTVNKGDEVCHSPFWIVYRQPRGGRRTAVMTFFAQPGIGDPSKGGTVPEITAEARAKAFATTSPEFKARRISPHGHQQRR